MTEHITPYRQKSISQFVLASSSPRRKELVATLNLSLPVSVFSLETDEHIEASWTPAEAVEKLSTSKAQVVCSALHSGQGPANIDPGHSLILAADTVVVLENDILGKPSSMEDAVSTLLRLQGKTHQVMTGVTLLHSGTGGEMDKDRSFDATMYLGDIGQYRIRSQSPSGQPDVIVGHTVSKVTFRPMSSEEIVAYVKTGEPLDKAGSYGVQGLGAVFIEKIEGDFFSVMGLPLNLLYQMLLKFGISPFQIK